MVGANQKLDAALLANLPGRRRGVRAAHADTTSPVSTVGIRVSAPQQLGLTLRRTDSAGKRQYVRSTRALAPEHQMQAAWCDHLSLLIAPPGERSRYGVVWWSVDHANAASAVAGALRKKRGVISAIPDLVFHWPVGQCGYVEIKTVDGELSRTRTVLKKRGGNVRAVQKLGQAELHDALRASGHRVAVARCWGDLVHVLRCWGVPFTREMAVCAEAS